MEPVDPTPVGEPLLANAAALDVDEPDEPDEPNDAALLGAEPQEAPDVDQAGPNRRRALLLGLVAAVAVLAVGVGVLVVQDDAPPPKPSIPVDAWLPYWRLDETTESRIALVDSMREVSPFWYNATGVDGIELDPNADPARTERFLDLVRSSDARVVPSIVDALPAGGMAAILADPVTRSRHVESIVAFASDGDFDGIDLDYERFAFADQRDTWESTRPDWVAFVEDLADALHADGRSLSVSIPPIYDTGRSDSSGYWVYDHGAIAEHVDLIRIMAYDYSVGEPGPIAPLFFVEDAISGALEAIDDADKIVLGVPLYGKNWPTGLTGTCPAGTELDEITSVNNRTVDDLIELRDAVPVFDESTGEWSFTYEIEFTDESNACVQSREVHYVDADGARLRMDLARERRLGGIALWAFGFDDDAVWDEILATTETT